MEPGGYAWWYLDAISEDERHALTLIAFVGSVFSPYYALARRRPAPDPENHCAINIALYGGLRRWAMTERGRGALKRSPTQLQVGPSTLQWDGDRLLIEVDEIGAPLPQRIRGRIRLTPHAIQGRSFALDAAGCHRWQPIAPSADVEVDLDLPQLKWRGRGYLDHNRGAEPLEAGFRRWDWARSADRDGTRIFYDVSPRAGQDHSLSLHIDNTGRVTDGAPFQTSKLPASAIWRIARSTRCDSISTPQVVETLEDTPFYARSLVRSRLEGAETTLFHESLDLNRFASPIVQCMLPFRMPRRAGW